MKKVSDSNTKNLRKFFGGSSHGVEKETSNFKYSGLKFKWLYRDIKIRYKFLIVIIAAMCMGVITIFFVQNTGLYSPGISGITQSISRFVSVIMYSNNASQESIDFVATVLFYLFTAVVNIPGLIFSYKKIGKQFAMLTTTYVIFSTVFPFLLSLIPSIRDVHLFGDVSSSLINENNMSGTSNFPFILWNYDNEKVISLIFYAAGFSILASIPLTFCYVIGASAGGFDVVAIYLLKVKRKQLGTIFLFNNLILLLIGSFFGTFLTSGIFNETINDSTPFKVENFFSPNLLCTLILIFTFSTILNKIYPRFKMIGVKIISPKKYNLDQKMFSGKYNHTRLISYGVGGYQKEQQEIITIYCFIFEVNELILRAKDINKNAFITIDESISIDGSMSYKKFLF